MEKPIYQTAHLTYFERISGIYDTIGWTENQWNQWNLYNSISIIKKVLLIFKNKEDNISIFNILTRHVLVYWYDV